MLGGIGATLCVSGAANVWLSQILPEPPGVSLWPLPALVLADIAVLGLTGFGGVLLENQPHSLLGVRVTWISCGGLTALAIIGAFGVSIVVLSVVPALLFGGAAILADIRRGRNLRADLGVFTVSVVGNLILIFVLISVAGV